MAENGAMFEVEKKDGSGGKYAVYNVMPGQTSFGSMTAIFFMYSYQDKKFMFDESDDYQMVQKLVL